MISNCDEIIVLQYDLQFFIVLQYDSWNDESNCPICKSHATKINLGTYFSLLITFTN